MDLQTMDTLADKLMERVIDAASPERMIAMDQFFQRVKVEGPSDDVADGLFKIIYGGIEVDVQALKVGLRINVETGEASIGAQIVLTSGTVTEGTLDDAFLDDIERHRELQQVWTMKIDRIRAYGLERAMADIASMQAHGREGLREALQWLADLS